MTYTATPDEQARKLRLVGSAAASAVGNGCDPDEVLAAVEAALQEALRLREQRAAVGDRPGRHARVEAEVPQRPRPARPLPAAVIEAERALDELDRLIA